MHAHAFDQFVALERDHWWFRGRRVVYLDVLRRALRTRPRLALDLGADFTRDRAGVATQCPLERQFAQPLDRSLAVG